MYGLEQAIPKGLKRTPHGFPSEKQTKVARQKI